MSKGQQPLCEPELFEPLQELVKRYGIVNLVETGTGPSSSGLEAAKRLGLRGYSCDVFRPCVERAAHMYPGSLCFHGESLGFFAHILPTLVGPTFFWLDAHTDEECPVMREIAAINRSPLPHVILVDDARLFGLFPAWPNKHEVLEALSNGGKRTVYEIDDVIVAEPCP